MMDYTDLMIDLETLGTAPGSIFTQIGLCAFRAEPDAGNLMESRNIFVDMDSALRHGLKVNGSTLRYWLREKDAPRLMMADEVGTSLTSALLGLSSWVQGRFGRPEHGSSLLRVWGYGPSFDIALLDYAAEITELKLPWEHGQIRCVRTMKELFPGAHRPDPVIGHVGEDDAIAQAYWVQNMWREFKQLKEMADDGTPGAAQERDRGRRDTGIQEGMAVVPSGTASVGEAASLSSGTAGDPNDNSDPDSLRKGVAPLA